MKKPPVHADWSVEPLSRPAGPGDDLTSPPDPPIDDGASASSRLRAPMSVASSAGPALRQWWSDRPLARSLATGLAPVGVSPERVRRSAQRGMLGPAGIGVYAVFTADLDTRGLVLAVVAVLLVGAGVLWSAAARVAASELRRTVDTAGRVVQILGFAFVAHLTGGVAGPIGLLVLFAVGSAAVREVDPHLRLLAGGGVAAFVVVALLDWPSRSGAIVQAVIILGVAALCARHSLALTALRHRLAEASRIDPSTGYLNQRGFDERLDQELSRAARSSQPLTLVVVHADLGPDDDDHGAGEVLARTGQALGRTARAHDAIGRLGRDDFALILTDTGPDAAAIVVDRLRTAFADATSVRVGHASFPREAAHPQALHRLARQRSNANRFARRPDSRPTTTERSRPVAAGPRGDHNRLPLPIADLSTVAALVFGVGVVHAALLSRSSGAGAVAALCLIGLVGAVAAVVAAPMLARSERHRLGMTVVAAPLATVVALAAVIVDGGAASPLAVGLLAPLPLLALHLPRRLAGPIVAGGTTAFAIAALVGSPGAWHLAFQLGGFLAVTTACVHRAETAARQRAAYTDLSLVDDVTDTLNRRGLEERFAIDVARTFRQAGRITVVALDLDAYDELLDQDGWVVARELIRWAAVVLSSQVRGHDVVGRLDDDEFVLLVSNCTGDQAVALGDRLREGLAERTGIRFGVATLGQHGNDFESLYHHARIARGAAGS